MTLNKTNVSENSATFLDLNSEIKNNKFITSIYDKRKNVKLSL